MPIKATLQPSVKKSLQHLIMQRGKLCQGKSSILLISTGQGWLRGPGREDHVGKDGKKKPVQGHWLGHAFCLCGFLSHGPTKASKHAAARYSVRSQQDVTHILVCCHPPTGSAVQPDL